MKFCSVLGPRADILQKGEKLSQEGSNALPPTTNLTCACTKCNAVYLLQKRSSEYIALENACHLEAQIKNFLKICISIVCPYLRSTVALFRGRSHYTMGEQR